MHELSIALGIVKIAEEETKKAGKAKVETIALEIGSLSGVELDSLHYVWETAVKDSVLAHADLKIDYKKARAQCLECNTFYDLENAYDSCPECKSFFKNILQGKELKIKYLEVI